jgi:hypothetical protein
MRAIGFNSDFLVSSVLANVHNHVTATYQFLAMKKAFLEEDRRLGEGSAMDSFMDGPKELDAIE